MSRRSPTFGDRRGPAGDAAVRGVGDCAAIAIPIEDGGLDHLVLARFGTPFDRDESNLLRAASRVLTLTMRTIRTMAAEREQRNGRSGGGSRTSAC